MKKKIKWIVLAVILIGISGALYMASQPAPAADSGLYDQPISFEVVQEPLVSKVEVKGKSLYEQETLVYAPFGAKITEWTVADGNQVKEGDILFRLDQAALANEIEQQEAALKKQRLEVQLADYAGRQAEIKTGMGDSEEVKTQAIAARETVKLNRELSEVTAAIQEKELASKKKLLQSADYRATASGIFLYDNANKRQQAVSDNQYIGKIVDIDKLHLISYVGEQDVFRIREGMPVQVKINAMKQVSLKGEVLKVSKFAKTGADQASDEKAAQFEVIISLEPSEYLIAGLSLSGEIETERREAATVVSSMAIVREQGKFYVTLDKGSGQYERQEIKIGLETPEKTEVLEGLKPGDTVVLQ